MQRPSADTLYELQLLPQRAGEKSIFDLINQTRTYGGRDELRQLFTTPCTSPDQLVQRQLLFKFMAKHLDQLTIQVAHSYVVAAENHLISNLAWSSARSWAKRYRHSLTWSWLRPHDFSRLQAGTAALQLVLRVIQQKVTWLMAEPVPTQLQERVGILQAFFVHPDIKRALRESDSSSAILQADFVLRHQWIDTVRVAFNLLYQLDAYSAVARFTQTAAWTYPEFVNSDDSVLAITALKHPLLDAKNSVSNDFRLATPTSLALLTGGNMSGKTTFLKSCGIAIYLAHIGLAVPAQRLQLSFFNRLFTSIHLSDNLALGYSHFYSELMRIKVVAEAISEKQRIFLLADELFRGTNPDDALRCSRSVLDALIQQSGSLFMISSHLPEIGATYVSNQNVQFNCFKTDVVDGGLTYTHKIEPGIAAEQTGFLLLKQANILESLT
ncbi:hypothetical protein EXU85_23200 [Spirosoma sp. KCTC 42546]|uniref:MutS-related protein n=1 Tax=Spirosoma sp. KCTC 42546 TaxID=2520506 RepID=UPI001159AFEB|nr:hypothetical protein [Spirosoma sp. KCTC 42546]QDK81358.1 hypothetical protein EXU85_23200 [Spirosoma sp. KCTC 42546]